MLPSAAMSSPRSKERVTLIALTIAVCSSSESECRLVSLRTRMCISTPCKSHIDVFSPMANRYYREQFSGARSAGPSRAGTPCQLICCLASHDQSVHCRGPMQKRIIGFRPDEAPRAFSRGTVIDLGTQTMVFTSGTPSIDYEGRTLHVGDAEAQTRPIFELMEAGWLKSAARLRISRRCWSL